VTARWQSSRPSMVFSPYSMREYRPKSGTVYASRGFSKLDQIERLSRQDLPVPRTAKLREISHSIRRLWGGTVLPSPCALHARTYARSVHGIRCARSHCTAPHQKDPAGGQLIPTVLRLSELAGALRFIKPRQEV